MGFKCRFSSITLRHDFSLVFAVILFVVVTYAFFERLVIDVLLNMGYGGSRKEAGQAMSGKGSNLRLTLLYAERKVKR